MNTAVGKINRWEFGKFNTNNERGKWKMSKNTFNDVKDSGKRQDFSTGAHRDIQEGKGRFDLIPPYTMYRLARHFENGAKKYGDSNWAKGIPLKRYLDSSERHHMKLKAGFTDEDHAIAEIWNLVCFIETKKRIDEGILPIELDDLSESQANQPKKWDE
jgi:hypothetical protein